MKNDLEKVPRQKHNNPIRKPSITISFTRKEEIGVPVEIKRKKRQSRRWNRNGPVVIGIKSHSQTPRVCRRWNREGMEASIEIRQTIGIVLISLQPRVNYGRLNMEREIAPQTCYLWRYPREEGGIAPSESESTREEVSDWESTREEWRGGMAGEPSEHLGVNHESGLIRVIHPCQI